MQISHQDFSSFAWRLAKGGPVQEEVETHLHFQIIEQSEIATEEIEDVVKATYKETERNLGILSDLTGDTAATGEAFRWY